MREQLGGPGRRWRGALVGALAVVVGVGATAAAAPGGSADGPTRRALPVADRPEDLRSGDEDHLGDEAPPPRSPAVPLEAGRNDIDDDSPWAGRWGPEIEPLAVYEPQRICLPGARPAVAAFAALLEEAYPIGRSLGIVRACDVGARSEHKEGRAYDWGMRVTDPRELAAADELVAWLLATDEHGNDFAMARRLGVMYVIWDGHIWSSTAARAGWRPYRGPSPHTDHVHVSFSWDGARGATSFWDGVRTGPWLFGGIDVGALPDSLDLGLARYRSELGERPGALRTWGEPPTEGDEPPPTRSASTPPPADDRAGEPAPIGAEPSPPPTAAPLPSTDPDATSDLAQEVEDLLTPLPRTTTPPPTTVLGLPTTTVPLVDDVVDAIDDALTG